MRRKQARKRFTRRAAVALALLVVGVTSTSLGSAYTSRDTGPAGISGFAVSGLRFDLGAAGEVTEVSFRLSPAGAHTVRAQFSPAGSWVGCSVAGRTASCVAPAGTSAGAIDQLAVLAAS